MGKNSLNEQHWENILKIQKSIYSSKSMLTEKIVTWAQFHLRSKYSFCTPRSWKCKKDTDDKTVFFYGFGIYKRKSCA